MNLVEWLKRVMVSTGSEWVMWIMIILSVGSVAIILERAWFFNSLRDDLARDRFRVLEVQAAGVREQEPAAQPLHGPFEPVTRDAGDRIDDGAPRSGEPIEQRRLSDVRPADDRHAGQAGG